MIERMLEYTGGDALIPVLESCLHIGFVHLHDNMYTRMQQWIYYVMIHYISTMISMVKLIH